MKIIHIVPHTHWDREWYLPFQSFRIKLVHLIDALLDILDQDPDFSHFTMDGQTIVIEDYLEIRPEREADLIRHIRSGRLIIGPWYILPDEFLVSPEATVRNLLQGGKMCARIGKGMEVGYLPDPFGHISQMPQILQGFGIETAAFRRGLSDEPCELWWEAPDGSRVLTAYLRDGYDNAAQIPSTQTRFLEFVRERRDSLIPNSAVRHLLLLNGTDHQEAQPWLTSLLKNSWLEDDRMFISTLPAYLEAVQRQVVEEDLSLPVVHGELRDQRRHHLLPGVLSSRTWIKQRNHTCEVLLERWAEPFSAWAELMLGDLPDRTVLTGHIATPRVRQPVALLEEAWRLLLQCHPHDSICGCSADQVHEEMRARFDQVEQIGEEITRQSLTALAEAVDTTSLRESGARCAIVVFNPDSQPRTDLVEATFEVPAGVEHVEVVDEQGQIHPHRTHDDPVRTLAELDLDPESLLQLLGTIEDGRVQGAAVVEMTTVQASEQAQIVVVLSEDAEPDVVEIQRGYEEIEKLVADGKVKHFRLHARFVHEGSLSFIAHEVPAHGYRLFGIRPATQGSLQVEADEGRNLDNGLIRVEAEQDGTLTLIDLRNGMTFPNLLQFRDDADRGDSYNFCPVDGDEPIQRIDQPFIRRYVDGVEQWLEIDLLFRVAEGLNEDRTAMSRKKVDLPVNLRVRLLEGVPRVDLEITLINQAEDHRIQVLFPLPLSIAEAFCGGHYDILRRSTELPPKNPDWIEQPVMEFPMRDFIAAKWEERGLMVSSRGLREGSVSPDGVIAVTLLRCFGWLSRGDLSTRNGVAGPQVFTPGGQEQGEHVFQLSLIPFEGNLTSARIRAEAFQSALRAIATNHHEGDLPSSTSFISIDKPDFAVTAIKLSEDWECVVVRGVNLSEEPFNVQLESFLPIRTAYLARIDETPLEEIRVDDSRSLVVEALPRKILTLRLELDPDFSI
ncbi:MAG: hypothetical protein GTO18_22305 [Anaerolineales bacterium]|nr:hypothetical protein [Anaerolineales bacterium]